MLEGVRVFTEGYWYLKKEHEDIIDLFEKNSAVLAINGLHFSFRITGFLICNNNPVVIFPKNFVTCETCFKTDASILLRTLLRYRMEKIHPEDESAFLNGNESNSNGRIISAIMLLNDYQNYGFLKRVEKIKTTRSNGNIDWNATINKTIPIINHNRPIYVEPIIKKTAYNANHIVIQIHKAVISECAELWGWITGFSGVSVSFSMPCSAEDAVRILTKELTITYANREINVLRNMIAYLKCKIGKNTQEHIEMLATPYFYYTWEYICSHVFENQYGVWSSILPQPAWKETSGKYNISQRPDILFAHRDCFYILDAKYYDYNKSLPGWQDAVKQLFYQYTIENSKAPPTVRALSSVNYLYNAFILPENTETEIKYLGYVEVDNVSGLNKIHAFAMNTRTAMEAYAGGLKSKLKFEVIERLKAL
ncbi:LlaJI family restriction endonuclease [Anaerotignum sp. MB30-C6]|uniref:LlaJI family restriction endonuclease n=1 Tax=Anaerotignum sp. MB30-C6 TaxID=3070814 RepID=UPI0027DC7473|nr:LlaJI family restriction endonuclease [Anaerotignum sp. MB30-C6]WMI82452.1 LlaJI family restriction endonuclease [Anaerotignum sp. MB30-C6]